MSELENLDRDVLQDLAKVLFNKYMQTRNFKLERTFEEIRKILNMDLKTIME